MRSCFEQIWLREALWDRSLHSQVGYGQQLRNISAVMDSNRRTPSIQQGGRLRFQGLGDLLEHGNRRVPDAPLHAGNIGSVHTSTISQFLLADLLRLPGAPHIEANTTPYVHRRQEAGVQPSGLQPMSLICA